MTYTDPGNPSLTQLIHPRPRETLQTENIMKAIGVQNVDDGVQRSAQLNVYMAHVKKCKKKKKILLASGGACL